MNWTETRTEMPVYVCQASTDGRNYIYILTK